MNPENIIAAKNVMNSLSKEEIAVVMESLVMDEKIDVPLLVTYHVKRLEKFRQDARHDMHVLSQAGIDLAYKEIKNINKLKESPAKEVAKAQAKILIDAGGYQGTKYGDEVKKSVDTRSLDNDYWFNRAWALRVNGQ